MFLLVLAHLGSPAQRAIKQLCVCVALCHFDVVYVYMCVLCVTTLQLVTCCPVSTDEISCGFVWSFVVVGPCKIFIMV